MKILRKYMMPIISLLWIGILINANSHLNDYISFIYYEKTIINSINFIRSISVLIVILFFIIFYFKHINFQLNNLIFLFYTFILVQVISFFLIRDLTQEYDQFYFILNQFLILTFFYFIFSLNISFNEKLKIYENLFKILIIFIFLVIIVLGKNMYSEFLSTESVNFYYGYFVSPNSEFLGQGVPRITGISRLVLILAIIISIILLYGKYKAASFLALSFVVSMLLLGDTRFSVYAFLIVSLFLIVFDKQYSFFKKLIYFISLVVFAYVINFSLIIAKNSSFTENTLYINKNIEGITEDEKKLREKRDLMKYFSLDANEIWHLGRRAEKQQEFNSRILEDFSTSGRTEDWKNNITFFKKRPLYGYGFQGDRFLTNEPVSNAYIYSLISGGIIGFILFTIITFLSFTKCIKAIFFDKIFYDKSKIILKCSVLINLVILLRTLIENSFSVYNFDLILFLVTYSIIYLNETKSKKFSK